MTMIRRLAAALAVAATLVPTAALAHPGAAHVHGLLDGLAHPLLGADHLAAMLAVGLIAARAGGRALYALPAAFVTAMLGGAGLALAGTALPGIETGIALSLLAFGALVAFARPLPAFAAAALVALAGLAHGQAHGLAAPAAGSALAYAAGFAAATAALHAAGAAVGLRIAAGHLVLRGAGAATALGGLAVLAAG